MTKEDYMKLSKERLTELLVEKDNEPKFIPYTISTPVFQPPCFAPDGICTNPFHDCINCPKTGLTDGFTTTCDTKLKK